MCGRYRLSRRGKDVAEEFAIEEDVEWTPQYNIAPSDQIRTVLQDANKPLRLLALMLWGMILFWTVSTNSFVGYWDVNWTEGDWNGSTHLIAAL
jgi:putative SOS response-associated peptidase YedK